MFCRQQQPQLITAVTTLWPTPRCSILVKLDQGRIAATTNMAVRSAVFLFVAVVLGTVAAQTQSPYPILNITKGAPLPELKELQPDASGWITLNMQPATIVVCCGLP